MEEVMKWLDLFATLAVLGILHNSYQIMRILEKVQEKIKEQTDA